MIRPIAIGCPIETRGFALDLAARHCRRSRSRLAWTSASSVPRTCTAPPFGPTQDGERATIGIEFAVTRRIPPAFGPFGRDGEVRIFPTMSVPRVYAAPPHGPSLTGESATERVEPFMRARVPPAPESLGRDADVRIQTELGGSHRTLRPQSTRGPGRTICCRPEAGRSRPPRRQEGNDAGCLSEAIVVQLPG